MSDDGNEDRLGMTEGARKRGPGRPPRAPQSDRRMFDEHALDDREHDRHDDDADREEVEDERLNHFLDTQHQTVLPSLPRQDGYHICWLTTTNSRDTIHWRKSIGYELISLSDHPEWSGASAHSGDYAGYVTVGEMIAARISHSQYDKFMRAVHHNMPLAEEEKLRSQAEQIRRGVESQGSRVTEVGNGTAQVVQRVSRLPSFPA